MHAESKLTNIHQTAVHIRHGLLITLQVCLNHFEPEHRLLEFKTSLCETQGDKECKDEVCEDEETGRR